ncbi:VWA domain-containing protein [Rugosimonospora acidiphila]|uniref:VWA domain-containing protein n=1 Tax=Rugosimonospora acidiphila TaxID=556531 RepID=A0ABP9RW04_9ACTN
MSEGASRTPTDLAELVARFGERLRLAGLPAGPDRCQRFTRAVRLVAPRTTTQLRWCARATLAAEPAQLELLDRVFDEVFGGLTDPADGRGDPNAPPRPPAAAHSAPPVPGARAGDSGSDSGSGRADARQASADEGGDRTDVPSAASAAQRFGGRDFAELTVAELALLADVMGQLRVATPPRRSRRTRPVPHGDRVDLRATLRLGRRTGGDPLRMVRRRYRDKPRRLVALCDISRSMEPYARAMLQLLYCAAGGTRAEVFTFATRLTRLTPMLARSAPAVALALAGRSAPDWSGGTRIAASLKEFTDRYGRRGLARGAVILIISDGWESGDPAPLGREMARLSRLAYRIVWVNPRTQSPRYRPLVGGMAAAWPHCDAVVSAHRLTALSDLIDALADPRRRRTNVFREG